MQVVFSTAAATGMAQLLAVALLLTYIVTKTPVLDLVLTLQTEPAPRILRSRIAEPTLSSEVTMLHSRIDLRQLNTALAVPLTE
jgi:hypothetical protein